MPTYNTTEYQNLIGGINDIGALLEEELGHNLSQQDVDEPVNNASQIVAASTAMLTFGASQPLLPSVNWNEIFVPLQQGLNSIKSAGSQIVAKGFQGLVAFGRVALIAISRLFAVTAVASLVIFGVYKAYETVSNIIYDLEAKIRQLEVDNSILQTKQQRLETRIETLETQILQRLDSLEVSTGAGFSALTSDLTTFKASIEASIEATQTAIQNRIGTAENTIPTNTASRLERGDGLLQSTYSKAQDAVSAAMIAGNNADQARVSTNAVGTKVDTAKAEIIDKIDNFRSEGLNAAAIGTIVAAGLERPDGMLDQLTKKVSTATEGIPANADPDYSAAVAGGTAVAAGTLGYAGFKNRKWLTGKIGAALGNINFGTLLSALNLLFSLQTAMMVSRDIVETSAQLIDTVIDTFMNAAGMKDINEDPIDFSAKVKEGFNIIMTNLIGAQNWEVVQAKFKKMNMILNAANTLFWNVRELYDNVGSLSARSCDFIAQLANNMKANGFTSPNFPWMSENNYTESKTGAKINNALNNIQDTVSIMYGIMADIESSQQLGLEVLENKEKLEKALTDSEPKATPENKKVKAREEGE